MKSLPLWDSTSNLCSIRVTNLMYGTLEVRKQFVLIGEITLNKLMESFGLWTAQTN